MIHSNHNPKRTINQIIANETTPVSKTYDERYAEHEDHKTVGPKNRQEWDKNPL